MRLGFVLSGLLTLFVLAPLSSGCRHTPSSVKTPQGVTAYQLEDAVDAVNLLQHEAIQLNRAGKLSVATTRLVVRYRRHAAEVMDKAIDAGTGKEAAVTDVSNSLAELERALGPDKASLRSAVEAVRVVLVALGGH